MVSYTTKLVIKDAVEECTPSRLDVIAHKFGEDGLKGAVAGAVTGAMLGAETGPGALITGGIGGAIGTIAGGVTGLLEGMNTTITPDGACMAKHLLSENVTPLDTPGNPQKPSSPKRTV